MKKLIVILILVFSYSSIAAQTNQNNSLTAKTEPPVLVDIDKGGISYAMPESEYQKLALRLAKYSSFIPIKRKPKKLSASAKFGINLVVDKKNIGWILDGSEIGGYTLYADINGDGDLTNDRPLKLKKTDGKYSYIFQTVLTEIVDNRKQKYPVQLKIEVAEEVPLGKTEKQLALKTSDATVRRGMLDINNRRTAFALSGSQGIYNSEFNYLYLDLNGDGRLDTETKYSEEAYKISEKYINIGETTYEFTVDRYGDNLSLKPLPEKLPARPALLPGSPAPDFSFKDLDGRQRRLSEFRGKVVLLDFWGTWCAPCIAEAPNLAKAYQRLKEKGFEIISVDKGDAVEDLRKFISEKQMNWTHTQIDDALSQLFRINGFPTYFLLDKEGKIVSNTLRPGEEMYKKIEEMLGS
ncbi:MAG TPA: TlpA disulfide reductase family protein [Pyrinomonadaceae bacterium]|jgi:thiol-disulfide isomerase/thioredoxin